MFVLKRNALWYPLRFRIIIFRVLAHCVLSDCLSWFVRFSFMQFALIARATWQVKSFIGQTKNNKVAAVDASPRRFFARYENDQPLEIRFCSFGWSFYASFGLHYYHWELAVLSFACLCAAQPKLWKWRENSLAKFIVRFNCVMEFFPLQHFNARVFFCRSLSHLFVCQTQDN